MNLPFIIAISGISGSGKTTLAKYVQKSLPGSQLFCFDDFDDTNVYPKDFYEWSQRGGDPLEFDCPGMADAVNQAIRTASPKYIVLDYPFGRTHPRFASIITLSIFINTPLDVAMARRILRDYRCQSGTPVEGQLQQLQIELTHYLEKARYVYLQAIARMGESDLVLDGCSSLELLKEPILAKVHETFQSKIATIVA